MSKDTGEPVAPRYGGRVTLPLYENGKICGFTSRALDPAKYPKYMTSAKSSAFDRTRVSFNIQNAQKHIDRTGFSVIAEGPFDAMLLSIHGVKNVISTLGTEFNAPQIPKAKVVCIFDNGKAGDKGRKALAALRPDALFYKVPCDDERVDIAEFLEKNPEFNIAHEIEQIRNPLAQEVKTLLRRVISSSIDDPEIFYDFVDQLKIDELPDCDEKVFFATVIDYGTSVGGLLSNKELMKEAGISDDFVASATLGLKMHLEDNFWIAEMIKKNLRRSRMEQMSQDCDNELKLTQIIVEAGKL